jgi:hypothetical protein
MSKNIGSVSRSRTLRSRGSSGEHPSKATIWPINELGRVRWVGRTYGIPRWRVDGRTLAEADLQHARSQLAGVVSEMVFDSDFRLASSVDEIAIAQGIVLTAATKLRRDVQQLWLETLISVATILRANEWVVRDIAAELMNRGSVKANRLAHFSAINRRRPWRLVINGTRKTICCTGPFCTI